jgi:ATP-dependent helicase Lhr and Lhr-like helicase
VSEAFQRLHPSLQYHIVNSLGWSGLRPVQEESAHAILDGANCVILAPTAGGKTESAIFPLVSLALSEGRPPVSILYLCPLRALLNNQEARLERLLGMVGRTVFKWHGDVTDRARKRMQKDPPDLLMTTPESLEVMLMSKRVAQDALFGHVAAVVIDEVHAFAGDDRGGHLASVLERVTAFCQRDIQRIGLSATVGNPADLLPWLQGSSKRPQRLVDPPRPPSNAEVELDFVGTVGNAARVVAALHQGKKRLLFADSRSMVEELGQHLRTADVQAAIIHSSLAFSERQAAERAFAEWEHGVIVSTSAMELGIDIGDLDHVLQVGAPTTVSSFLQRMGRTGRRPGTRPNTTFLTLERDNSLSVLVAAGILRLWRRGWVEPIVPDAWSVHLLAHQLLALAVQERGVPRSDWWAWIGSAAPFRAITPEERESIIEHMLAKDILSTDGVRLTLGDEGQKRYGRRHFLELSAVFLAPPTLTVMHGNTELGTIDPLLLLSREGRPLVLALGGRSWRVGHVDWTRGRCVVEPSTEPGRSTWQGEPKWLSRELAAAIREVLVGTGEDPGWTPRAARTIANLRAEHAYIAQAPHALHERPDGTIEWWTFAGGRANNLLAAVLEELLNEKIVANSLRIRFEDEAARSSQAIYGAVRACIGELDERTARRLGAQRARGPLSKFQPCLPPALEERFVARRIFDLVGARVAANELTGSN